MTEAITDAFKCNQCGALYDSGKELLEHQQAAHHAVVSDLKPHEKDSVSQQDKAKAKNAQATLSTLRRSTQPKA